jgi:hypothetical protein
VARSKRDSLPSKSALTFIPRSTGGRTGAPSHSVSSANVMNSRPYLARARA